ESPPIFTPSYVHRIIFLPVQQLGQVIVQPATARGPETRPSRLGIELVTQDSSVTK
ncbi:MAG: hypothetical protein ACI89X_005151, partial [Planctomycetota bacterium]